jgi:uncharacterized membrane protein (UPF0127 family)
MEFEICDTPEKYVTGLQFRESLPEDRVLVFNDPQDGSWEGTYFHMRNVRFPIAIAALDAKGVVLALKRIEPETGRFFPPRGTAQVMEMTVGFSVRHGLKVGKVFPRGSDYSPRTFRAFQTG